MKTKLTPLIALVLPLWLTVLPVQAAVYTDYLPMLDADYARKHSMQHLLTLPPLEELLPGKGLETYVQPEFPKTNTAQRLPSDGKSLPGWRFPDAGASGVTLQLLSLDEIDAPAEWVLQGKDKAGQSWSVYTGQLYDAESAQFYQTDLDRNGINDLIIWAPHSCCGMAPTGRLEIITFESNGRPLLLETWGYYSVGKNGIDDFLDLNNDGHTQLLTMHLSEGYWITDLYQVDNARWRRVQGRLGGQSYPATTHFTYGPNRRLATRIIAGRHPQAPDLSNDQPFQQKTFRLADAEGAQVVAGKEKLELPGLDPALTLDTPSGRTILTGSAGEEHRKATLRKLFTQSQPVWLYGRKLYRTEPAMIWALPN